MLSSFLWDDLIVKCKKNQRYQSILHIFNDCPLHPGDRQLLRKVFPELDSMIIIDTKKDLEVVLKFLGLLSQPLCWLFAWLEQVVEALLTCQSLVLIYRVLCANGFSYRMELFMQNSTPSKTCTYNMSQCLCIVSLIDTNIFEIHVCMSFYFMILFVTIWCKANKLSTL